MKTIYVSDGSAIKLSDCDLMWVIKYRWAWVKGNYYQCSVSGTFNGHKTNGMYLHRYISELMGLKIPKGLTIDHIDRDTLNNQRSNLRIASYQMQNQNRNTLKSNTNGFEGVQFMPSGKYRPWKAEIRAFLTGKITYLGCFETPEEASSVYQAAKSKRNRLEEERVKEYLCQEK